MPVIIARLVAPVQQVSMVSSFGLDNLLVDEQLLYMYLFNTPISSI